MAAITLDTLFPQILQPFFNFELKQSCMNDYLPQCHHMPNISGTLSSKAGRERRSPDTVYLEGIHWALFQCEKCLRRLSLITFWLTVCGN